MHGVCGEVIRSCATSYSYCWEFLLLVDVFKRKGAIKNLAWNCHGMLSATTIRELLEPKGVCDFLSKSHLNKDKATKLRLQLGFDLFHVVVSYGRASGLVLFLQSNK